MALYDVVECFTSINGEGVCAGQLALFIRFKECNLNCSYCDTRWANSKDSPSKIMTDEDIVNLVKNSGVKNITLTGGEPLLRKNMDVLLKKMSEIEDIRIEIETNGSIDLKQFSDISKKIVFTMDYKLPSSKMEKHMCLSNFSVLKSDDTVKFVAGSIEDLDCAKKIIDKYKLIKKINIYLSPVFGSIDPADIVEYMKKYNMNYVNLQLQLHKFIWDPNKKGV